MDKQYLAAGHSLADVSHLPWWAQALIGLALIGGATGAGKLAGDSESCLLSATSFFLGIAGLVVLYTALFG